MLARLIAQAQDEGAELVTLRAVVEEVCELGAKRVLAQMGLDDESAQGDLIELRQLLRAWRDAKSSAWKRGGQLGGARGAGVAAGRHCRAHGCEGCCGEARVSRAMPPCSA